MRKIIIIVVFMVFVITSFAQTMNWWVVDQGGGMQVFGSDTMWASIGQTAIGERNAGGVYLGAGYLYIDNTTLEVLESKQIPKKFAINSIYPNPFNSSCAIEFEVSEECDVAIALYDMQGKTVGVQNFEPLQAGKYRMRWNADNLPSGIYFVRLNAGDKIITKRAILIR